MNILDYVIILSLSTSESIAVVFVLWQILWLILWRHNATETDWRVKHWNADEHQQHREQRGPEPAVLQRGKRLQRHNMGKSGSSHFRDPPLISE